MDAFRWLRLSQSGLKQGYGARATLCTKGAPCGCGEHLQVQVLKAVKLLRQAEVAHNVLTSAAPHCRAKYGVVCKLRDAVCHRGRFCGSDREPSLAIDNALR